MDYPQSKGASMLIICNSIQSAETLQKILSHYFPSNETGQLNLTTKYYTASIAVKHQTWPSLDSLLSEHSFTNPNEIFEVPSKPEEKHDLLIMLAAPQESYPALLYDLLIHKYNPDNLLLIVDTKNKEQKWADEQTINGEVNNFIEIAKEDLEALAANLPERTKTGLLQQNNQNWCIFDLLELMETTQWSQMNRVESSSQKTTSKTEQKMEKIFSGVESEPEEKKQIQPQQKPSSQEEPVEQMSEEQLEQEMMNFEAMMSEMMSMRNAGGQGQPVSHEQRKKTAQDLIHKLLQGSLM